MRVCLLISHTVSQPVRMHVKCETTLGGGEGKESSLDH